MYKSDRYKGYFFYSNFEDVERCVKIANLNPDSVIIGEAYDARDRLLKSAVGVFLKCITMYDVDGTWVELNHDYN